MSKNSLGWPMKSPMSVKNLTTPMEMPFVSVGRMIEHLGSFRLRNGHGRLVSKVCPSNGGLLRLGNVNPFVGWVRGRALPALSDQV
jgi:hypothetical protein